MSKGIELPEGLPPISPGGGGCLPDGHPPVDGFEFCNPVEDEEEEESSPPPPDGGSTSPSTTKPPTGSSLLFGALADSGRIKQRKNGSYRMVLKGVDEVDHFPSRENGSWSTRRMLRKWDDLFESTIPMAEATFNVSSERKSLGLRIFKPRLIKKRQNLSFKIRPIGFKNKDTLVNLGASKITRAAIYFSNNAVNSSEMFGDGPVNPPAGWRLWINGWQPIDMDINNEPYKFILENLSPDVVAFNGIHGGDRNKKQGHIGVDEVTGNLYFTTAFKPDSYYPGPYINLDFADDHDYLTFDMRITFSECPKETVQRFTVGEAMATYNNDGYQWQDFLQTACTETKGSGDHPGGGGSKGPDGDMLNEWQRNTIMWGVQA